ncbi:Nuclear distribution protein PAC1-2 [Metarhizium anisopliae]
MPSGTSNINIKTRHYIKALQGHTDWVRSVCTSTDGRCVLSAGNSQTVRLRDISGLNYSNVLTLKGHNHGISCCTLVHPTSYLVHLAVTARLKAPPPATSPAEFIATGSRENTIKLWNTRGSRLIMLIFHETWVIAVVLHPGVRYLLSAADEKTLRCWDLGQE